MSWRRTRARSGSTTTSRSATRRSCRRNSTNEFCESERASLLPPRDKVKYSPETKYGVRNINRSSCLEVSSRTWPRRKRGFSVFRLARAAKSCRRSCCSYGGDADHVTAVLSPDRRRIRRTAPRVRTGQAVLTSPCRDLPGRRNLPKKRQSLRLQCNMNFIHECTKKKDVSGCGRALAYWCLKMWRVLRMR